MSLHHLIGHGKGRVGKEKEIQMKKIYLAGPYSHDSKLVKLKRFLDLNVKSAELMEKGFLVFSPISHSHPISTWVSKENKMSYDFWLTQDFWILEMCDELHVLCLDGWLESKGVAAEIKKAEELNIPIVHHYYIAGYRI